MDIIGGIYDLILQLSAWMKSYLNEIVLSLVATLLVIYGNDIMNIVKQQIGSLKLFLRFTLFIVFCAFGFSFLTSVASPFIGKWIAMADPVFLPLIIVLLYYLVGYLAMRKGML